jgi:hypothetical protein
MQFMSKVAPFLVLAAIASFPMASQAATAEILSFNALDLGGTPRKAKVSWGFNVTWSSSSGMAWAFQVSVASEDTNIVLHNSAGTNQGSFVGSLPIVDWYHGYDAYLLVQKDGVKVASDSKSCSTTSPSGPS